jgi:hypothetical protein
MRVYWDSFSGLIPADLVLAMPDKENAQTLAAWKELESAGFVRIELQDEDDVDVSYLDNWPHLSERSKKEMIDGVYAKGVYVVIGQFRTDLDSDEWETGDCIGDCQGYEDAADPHENCYVIDIMAETITALRSALKDRFCHKCGTKV